MAQVHYTPESDIDNLGALITVMVYANNPPTSQIQWPILQSLKSIVEACTWKSPEDRPTLDKLRKLAEDIETKPMED